VCTNLSQVRSSDRAGAAVTGGALPSPLGDDAAENQRRQAAEAQVKAPPGGVIGEQPTLPPTRTRHDLYDQ
jgi:hypothetical protein